MAIIQNKFGALDYIVLAAMLVISAAIGVYFAMRGGKQRTQGEYLTANRSMHLLPVSISILVSFISGILILGIPAEMYTQGTEYSISVIGSSLGIAISAVFFVPLLYPLKITSVFEYLELRFKSRSPRLMGTLLTILIQIIYLGIAAFAPATAFEAITGFPVWATLVITGIVSTFYTSIGGIKAVIFTEVVQGVIILAGILAILIQGILQAGGLGRVWRINEEWGRIKFFNFDPDPTVRHTVWSLVIGTMITHIGYFTCNQTNVQRYNSLRTLSNAKLSVMLNSIGIVVVILTMCFVGVVMFAHYAGKGCDPLSMNLVKNSNQLLLYFVMEILNYPGVPGLFVSCLFSGTLSAVSSSLNALAAVTWEDILKPYYDKVWSESKKTSVTKIIVVIYGCLALAMSLAVQSLGGTVLQAYNSFSGVISGPLIGMFILGAFFPCANNYGAVIGAICGLGVSMWQSVGSYVSGIPLVELPHPNGTCSPDDNMTDITNASITLITAIPSLSTWNTTAGVSKRGRSGLGVFYSISYLWLGVLGTVITIVVGLLISFITGPNSIHDVPLNYQIPLFSRLCCCLPKSMLYKLNCCRHFDDPDDCQVKVGDIEYLITSESLDTSFNDSKKGKGHLEIGQNGQHITKVTSPIIVQKLEYGALSETKEERIG